MGAKFSADGDHLLRTTTLMDYNSPYTVMAWFRFISSPAENNGIMSLNNDAGTLYDFLYHLSGTIYVEVNGNSTAGPTLSTDTWYHFTMVRYSVTDVTLYIDGVSEATQTTSVSGRAANTEENIGGVSSFGLLGDIAYYKSWSASLTQDEIKQEMNVVRPVRAADLHCWVPMFPGLGERVRDYSGNNNTWTEEGTVLDAEAPPVSFGGSIIYPDFEAALTLEQEGFRVRNDDGSEITATWQAAQDTNVNIRLDTNTRLRVLINATGNPATKQYQLEYRKVGDTVWRKVE